MKKNYLNILLSFLLMLPVFVACDKENGEDDPGNGAVGNTNANDNKTGATYVKTEKGVLSTTFQNRLEMPRLQAGDVFIVHQATDMTGSPVNYASAYVSSLKHPRWVAFRFDSQLNQRNTGRKVDNRANGEPLYPQDPLYSGTATSDAKFGVDHGHLCASADRLCSRVANDQTFYMSNMSPMIGDFNQNYWTKYESWLQKLARTQSASFDTLYVVKGGTIDDAHVLRYIDVDKTKMPQPKYYYIALLKHNTNGSYSAIGFWVEHKAYDTAVITDDDKEVSAHAVSIDELEALTGIDFFCNLNDNLENAVEKGFSRNAWGLPVVN